MNPPDPTRPRLIAAPPVSLDGFEHVAAFTSPVDIGPLAALLKCYGRAYPDSRVTTTTADGWTFVIAPIDRPGGRLKWEGGAAATGGKGSRGEAPDFFSGGSAPAPADAGPTAEPPIEATAGPSTTDPGPYAGHLVFGDVQRRRLHFEFDFMPPNCRLGSRWTVQPHSDEAAAAEIREAADHHDRCAFLKQAPTWEPCDQPAAGRQAGSGIPLCCRHAEQLARLGAAVRFTPQPDPPPFHRFRRR